MRRTALLIVTAGLLLAADSPGSKDPIKKEQKALQGTWILVSSEMNGRPLPEDEIKGTKLTIFKDDKFHFREKEQSRFGVIRLDPEAKPKRMEIIPQELIDKELLEKGNYYTCLYELDGSQLKLCLSLPGTRLPEEFTSKNDRCIQVWHREKN